MDCSLPFIHSTAEVSDNAEIGSGTRIWNLVQVREMARIGSNVVLSKNVYVDAGVTIGNNTKIQNNVSVYRGVTIEDGVFVGPHVCFTNDRIPRAVTADGNPKGMSDWAVTLTLVRRGASIGAHSVILAGVTIGAFAMVGAGSVVTNDVPAHALVYGNPARLAGFVCYCGERVDTANQGNRCPSCNEALHTQHFVSDRSCSGRTTPVT